MKKNHLLLSIIPLMFIVLAAGCIPPLSINPLYTDKDIVFDPDIIGTWSEDNFEEIWQFAKGEGDFYNLKLWNESGMTSYIVYLLKIKDAYYIDAYPDLKSMDKAHKDLNPLMIPIHSFFQVKKTKSTIELAIPNQRWLLNYLREHPDALPYDMIPDEKNPNPKDADPLILFTASTKQLQSFIIKIQNEKEAFEKGVNIKLQRLELPK